MKRLVFAYLIGLAACFISIAVVNRPNVKHVSFLYAAMLGVSSTTADLGHHRVGLMQLALAATLVSLLFVLAEGLRARGSWVRWMGYGLWALLAAASLFWFTPPHHMTPLWHSERG